MSDALRSGQAVVIAALVPASGDEDQARVDATRTLALRAGATVVGELIQRRGVSRSRGSGGARAMRQRAPLHSATLIGPGKVAELAALVRDTKADIVLFCNRLTPAQQQNLIQATGVRVVSSEPELV